MEDPKCHFVATLADGVADLVGMTSAARHVWLHSKVIAHIRERRTPSAAEFVFQHLQAAIIRPHMIGEEAKPGRLRIVHQVETGQRLHVSLKLVLAERAHSKEDEIWISTAYPISRDLTKLGNKPTLWRLVSEEHCSRAENRVPPDVSPLGVVTQMPG